MFTLCYIQIKCNEMQKILLYVEHWANSIVKCKMHKYIHIYTYYIYIYLYYYYKMRKKETKVNEFDYLYVYNNLYNYARTTTLKN